MIRLVLAVFCCLLALDNEAKIIETKHAEDVLPYIDQDTWFLVDLDNCLFEGMQALGHANWFYDELEQKMQKGIERNEAIKEFYPKWLKTQKICRVKPLEDSFVPLLVMLQGQGITVMGLTHRQPLIADSTVRQVSSLGFDFLQTAPSKENFVVPTDTPALYMQGILFASDYNKKIDVFEPFLAMIKKSPKRIVFIDDKKKNVEELESLTNYGIEYIGVYYTAIEHAKPIYNREIADFQYKYLDQILSNDAALLLMENGFE